MKITELTTESVAGPKNCWPGYRKTGTQPGTGKNAGKRVNDCEKIKEQGVADDSVGFEVDSENAYNLVMGKFGSVINWDGETMVAPRKYWGAIQELAHEAGGEATEVGDEHVDEASLATMRDYFAGDEKAHDPYEITKQRVHFSKDKSEKTSVQKKFKSQAEYEDWLAQQKNKKAFKVTEGVIIGRSESGDPMDPQVAVLGGAGSYSLKGLYNKAQRESAQLTKDIGLGNFRSSSYNVKQLANTLNTIVAAHNELEAIRKGGGPNSRGIERGVDTKE